MKVECMKKVFFKKIVSLCKLKEVVLTVKTRYLIIQIYSVKNFFSKNVDQR